MAHDVALNAVAPPTEDAPPPKRRRLGWASAPRRVIVHPDDIPVLQANHSPQSLTILAAAGYGPTINAGPLPDEATGLMPAEASMYGFTGVEVQSGLIKQEYNARIQTLADRLVVYEEMRRSEPAVAVIELLTTLPLAHCRYYIEPGDDPDFAAFLQWNLDYALQRPFSETMREAALGMLYGFTWCYPQYAPMLWKTDSGEERIYSGWTMFAPRVRSTTYQWRFNEAGMFSGLIQYGNHPVTMEPKYIGYDAEEIVLWTWRGDGGDPEGLGALRQAFKPYSYKEAGEEFAAIKIEREACGVLVAKCREDTPYNEGDEALILGQMANIRAGRTQGICLPDGWELDVLNIGGSGNIPFLDFIERQHQGILQTVGAQFVGGDLNTGIGTKDASNVFLMLVDFAADWICDTFNAQAIPQISRLNRIKEQKKARLLHGPVGVKDVEKFAMAIEKLTRHPENIPDEVLQTAHEEIGLPPVAPGTQGAAQARVLDMEEARHQQPQAELPGMTDEEQ